MKTSLLVAEYLNHKRALGHGFATEGIMLRALCRSTGDGPVQNIAIAQLKSFLYAGSTTQDTIARKHRALKGFYHYVTVRHEIALPALPVIGKTEPSSFVPHIYTREELRRLLQAAESTCKDRRGLLEGYVLRSILLLLYGAGLRLSEALDLNLKDVELTEAVVTVRQTKFHKTRLVPLGHDLTLALIDYRQRKCNQHALLPDSPFFCYPNGERVTWWVMEGTFRRLRKNAGVGRDGGPRDQPRLHDMRHSAAVHRLVSWYRAGVDLDKLLPMLATYLGHASLSGTQRYLTLTPELLDEASRRFEVYALGGNDG